MEVFWIRNELSEWKHPDKIMSDLVADKENLLSDRAALQQEYEEKLENMRFVENSWKFL